VNDWRHVRTERLWLDIAAPGDEHDLHAIHSDPRTWRHLPSGRHTDPAGSAAMVAASSRQFADHGLGYWSVRDARGGPVVGRAGCMTTVGRPWWNLYYRFTPAVHGRGYATESGRAALQAAGEVDPGRPVVAFLLEHNEGSRRTAERLGLHHVWRGPDAGNPDPAAVRLVYADRVLSEDLVGAVVAHH
jgi:RimJ/RimL family protein N-acetyltransferase